ncbi:hypothetical protein AGMMS50230_09040 [Spirochaetia bacterium]|nr:hypothetical protein AGMMS50230_09040 [Spirochaetia bacterium]
MPTYEYECKSCGHGFEAFQSMSEEPLKQCPQCGKEIRRLINGGSGIIFKGSGFYVTDKGKGQAQTKTTSSKTEKSAGENKGETKAACASCPAAANAATASGGSCPSGSDSPAKKAAG